MGCGRLLWQALMDPNTQSYWYLHNGGAPNPGDVREGANLAAAIILDNRRRSGAGLLIRHRSVRAAEALHEATSLHKDLCEKIATLSFSEQLDCEHWFLPCPVCGKRRCCKCLIGFAIYQGDPPSCRCERPSRRSQRLRTRLESTTTVWQDPAAALKSAFPELY